MIYAGFTVYLGGDLSYLTTYYGLSCSMIYPCFFCQKPFEKGSQSCPDLIDFTKYPARDETFEVFVKNRKLVAKKSPLIDVPKELIVPRDETFEVFVKNRKLVAKKSPLIDVPKELIVPPIIYSKIKIGNVLFEKFQDNEKNSKFFQEIVQRWNLNVVGRLRILSTRNLMGTI